MSETPDNQVTTEAPEPGASASAPEIHAIAGGKPRPSVAGAKRVRPSVAAVPAIGEDAAGATGEQPTSANQAQAPAAEGSADGIPSGDAPSTFDTAEDVRQRASVKKRKKLSKGATVAIVIVCLIGIAVCAAAFMRWIIPQDAADLQGTWAMDGAKNSIVISDSQIDLAGEASYDYSLDTVAKTVSVEFFTKGGIAHYRFSRDRQSVAIVECADYGWTSTLSSDLEWAWSDFVAMAQGQEYNPLGSDQGITLYRK